MMVPKEVLDEMHAAVRRGDSIRLSPEEILAILDDRVTMLMAAKDLATAFRARANMWPDKPEAFVYFAVARDIEEHPAFTQNRGDG